MFHVIITEPAEQDIQGAFEWWRDHRSADEAQRWVTVHSPLPCDAVM